MPIVEQLDRAAEELTEDHPISSRLALILIDNATELIIHRRCDRHVWWDREYRKLSKGKLSIKQRHLARAPFFEGKLIVLRALSEISEKEQRFITIAHSYRNELYHVGLAHEPVIRSLAAEYFNLSVELFSRLQPMGISWSDEDRLSEIGKRYFAKTPNTFLSLNIETLSSILLQKRAQTVTDLPGVLCEAAGDAIEQVEYSFDFLKRDNPNNVDEYDLLVNIQFHYDFVRRAEKENIEGSVFDHEHHRRMSDLRNEMSQTWRQKYRRIPVDEWRVRAREVGRERDPFIALDKYQSLRNDMKYLEEVTSEAAAELDAWIQLQVDIARDK